VDRVTDMNVKAAFAFAREAVSTFQARAINEERGGKRGTLLFTGATASLRGNTITAALSAAKLALPAGLCTPCAPPDHRSTLNLDRWRIYIPVL
jgi:NAD(P)-dependent dehydrogenase (short-subunit alcohol dehydrogenase family)